MEACFIVTVALFIAYLIYRLEKLEKYFGQERQAMLRNYFGVVDPLCDTKTPIAHYNMPLNEKLPEEEDKFMQGLEEDWGAEEIDTERLRKIVEETSDLEAIDKEK